MSGDVLVPNLFANKLYQARHSDIVFYSVVLYCIEKPLPGGVWIVSEGVWMESECLGMY